MEIFCLRICPQTHTEARLCSGGTLVGPQTHKNVWTRGAFGSAGCAINICEHAHLKYAQCPHFHISLYALTAAVAAVSVLWNVFALYDILSTSRKQEMTSSQTGCWRASTTVLIRYANIFLLAQFISVAAATISRATVRPKRTLVHFLVANQGV